LAVGCVAGEIGTQEALYVEEAEGEHGEKQRNEKKRPERAKSEGRGDEKNERAEIHRMADDAVESGGDDLLVFLDLDRSGGVGVGTKDKKCDRHAGDDAEIAQKHQWDGNDGPAEAAIESRQDDQGQRKNDGEK